MFRSNSVSQSSALRASTEQSTGCGTHAQCSRERDALKREWQICEELLAGSQSDNEHKHVVIENLKHYVKTLEGLLESALGTSWKEDHNISPPQMTTLVVNASTPLPKPRDLLRHSTSVTFSNKRGSRMTSRVPSGADFGSLSGLPENGFEADSTPTGAMRRLQGLKPPNANLLSDSRGMGNPGEPAQAQTEDTLADHRRVSSTTCPAQQSSIPTADISPSLQDVIKLLGTLSAKLDPIDAKPGIADLTGMLAHLDLAERSCTGRLAALKGLVEEGHRQSLAST